VTLRVGVSTTGLDAVDIEYVREARAAGRGFGVVPEFWAHDALTPIGFLAAVTSTVRLATGIVQLGARTPAMLAMSAMALQQLSGGRFVLGVGTSGPQVMQGWHGVRFDRPVRRTARPSSRRRGRTRSRRL
jgi:alkanesulfonate monooxygenase SsuD/methylene tetrahydromethanopterin reductase-like flavin-dependent oxidoreductase (luciferase family)